MLEYDDNDYGNAAQRDRWARVRFRREPRRSPWSKYTGTETSFRYNGAIYQAVVYTPEKRYEDEFAKCEHCAFSMGAPDCFRVPSCWEGGRDDGQNVVFKAVASCNDLFADNNNGNA